MVTYNVILKYLFVQTLHASIEISKKKTSGLFTLPKVEYKKTYLK